MYFLSSFNKLLSSGDKRRLYNSITNRYIGYNEKLENIIERVLNQQLQTLEDNMEGRLLQIITAELLCRGLIIYKEKKSEELNYLNEISAPRLPSKGFFNCLTTNVELLSNNNQKNIVFLGIPCDLGSSRPGSRYGPQILRNKSNSLNFRSPDEDYLLNLNNNTNVFCKKNLYDIGDISLTRTNIDTWIKRVETLLESIPNNFIPFLIGGDHSFTLPAIKALYSKNKDLTFVHLDYHLDLQIWGEFHEDQPKKLDAISHSNFVSWIKYLMPSIDIVQIGICSYQTITKPLNHDQVVRYLNNTSSRIMDTEILTKKTEEIASKIPNAKNIYLSIDVDVINSIYIGEHTGFPASTGIDLSKFLQLIKIICQNNKIIGVDIMEYGSSSKGESHSNSSTFLVYSILEIINSINEK